MGGNPMNRAIRSLALLAVAGTIPAFAQVALTDANSSANIDPFSTAGVDFRGMNNWTVDGVNHMFQQWFWFRVGEGGPESRVTRRACSVARIGRC